jgi:hypothetical protein
MTKRTRALDSSTVVGDTWDVNHACSDRLIVVALVLPYSGVVHTRQSNTGSGGNKAAKGEQYGLR